MDSGRDFCLQARTHVRGRWGMASSSQDPHAGLLDGSRQLSCYEGDDYAHERFLLSCLSPDSLAGVSPHLDDYQESVMHEASFFNAEPLGSVHCKVLSSVLRMPRARFDNGKLKIRWPEFRHEAKKLRDELPDGEDLGGFDMDGDDTTNRAIRPALAIPSAPAQYDIDPARRSVRRRVSFQQLSPAGRETAGSCASHGGAEEQIWIAVEARFVLRFEEGITVGVGIRVFHVFGDRGILEAGGEADERLLFAADDSKSHALVAPEFEQWIASKLRERRTILKERRAAREEMR